MLLQTLITRLITLTMRIQNWNNSENVTIITGPPFYVSEGTKRRFTLRKCGGGAARLPFIGSTGMTIP